MVYVMSDIHGEYDRYLQMLEKIAFTEDDILFVLGDAIDRGPEPVKVLQDMASRDNVFLLMGNHEVIGSLFLCIRIKESRGQAQLSARASTA